MRPISLSSCSFHILQGADDLTSNILLARAGRVNLKSYICVQVWRGWNAIETQIKRKGDIGPISFSPRSLHVLQGVGDPTSNILLVWAGCINQKPRIHTQVQRGHSAIETRIKDKGDMRPISWFDLERLACAGMSCKSKSPHPRNYKVYMLDQEYTTLLLLTIYVEFIVAKRKRMDHVNVECRSSV